MQGTVNRFFLYDKAIRLITVLIKQTIREFTLDYDKIMKGVRKGTSPLLSVKNDTLAFFKTNVFNQTAIITVLLSEN